VEEIGPAHQTKHMVKYISHCTKTSLYEHNTVMGLTSRLSLEFVEKINRKL